MNLNECYQIFDIQNNTTLNDIKKKYRQLALKYHPDKCVDDTTDKFIKINKAYTILLEYNTQSYTDKPNQKLDLDEIKCEGMLQTSYSWVAITCIINVDRETKKAVHGKVTVLEEGKEDPVYPPEIFWVPKSMCQNPWFICTKLYDEENKVANRRFDDD